MRASPPRARHNPSPVSQENVEIVRAAIDALNDADWDAMLSYAGPGFEYDLSNGIGLDQGVFGVEELRRLAEDFTAGWNAARYEVKEFIAISEHVVTPWVHHLKGRDGIEVQARGAWVWTFRDGAVARIRLYQELEEALDAARCGQPNTEAPAARARERR